MLRRERISTSRARRPGSDAQSHRRDLSASHCLRWSLLEGVWDPRDRYREQLRHAENILAFIGSVSLAILDKEDYEKAQLDLRVPWQGGISFSTWKLIVQRCVKVFRGYRDHPLAADIRGLNIGSEDKGFGADVAALIRARNDFHHGRGPTMEEDVLTASNEAQVRLQRCMEALSFFTKFPYAWYRTST